MLVLGAVMALSLVIPGASRAEAARPAPFSPGEEMVFEIGALGMTAGKARVSVGTTTDRDGVATWPIVVQAKTDSIFDAVYSVKDKFVTWWQPETGRVVGADFFADENGKRSRSRSVLDHAIGKAEVKREKASGERSVHSYDIPPGAYDIAGAVMALRARPLQVGDTEEISVFTGKKVFALRCRVTGNSRVKTEAGAFDAVETQIELGFDGNFASKRDVKAWFSNDERHLPLRVQAEFMLGSVVGELVAYHRGVSL
jgi:hypothetical protein